MTLQLSPDQIETLREALRRAEQSVDDEISKYTTFSKLTDLKRKIAEMRAVLG